MKFRCRLCGKRVSVVPIIKDGRFILSCPHCRGFADVRLRRWKR